MNEYLKNAYKDKFLKDCPERECAFLNQIEKYRETHITKAKENKDNYFGKNKWIIKGISVKTTVGMIASVSLSIITAIGVRTFIKEKIPSIFNNVSDKWDIILSGGVFFIILIGCVMYLLTQMKKNLELHRYGETWIRHTIIASKYEKEITEYVYELNDYSGKQPFEQRTLFMQNILKIEDENMKLFENNMKNINEVVGPQKLKK